MRFKQWFNEEAGLIQGGSNLSFGMNDNMPYGVGSKYVTKDAQPSRQTDPDKDMKPPEKTFGFRSPEDLKASKERRAKTIDKSRDPESKGVPIRNDHPDIVY